MRETETVRHEKVRMRLQPDEKSPFLDVGTVGNVRETATKTSGNEKAAPGKTARREKNTS
ncbi:MAG: hypothetical protein NC322_07990 [Alistipes senegalensis]|nr:hypothetical protein [Alistipes senegalensis]